MEHRYFSRLPLKMDVEIQSRGRYLGCFKTCDISFNGMSIKTESADLRENDVVGISVQFDQDETKSFKMKGLVIHHSEDACGVMFLRFYPEYISFFRELLQVMDTQTIDT